MDDDETNDGNEINDDDDTNDGNEINNECRDAWAKTDAIWMATDFFLLTADHVMRSCLSRDQSNCYNLIGCFSLN